MLQMKTNCQLSMIKRRKDCPKRAPFEYLFNELCHSGKWVCDTISLGNLSSDFS